MIDALLNVLTETIKKDQTLELTEKIQEMESEKYDMIQEINYLLMLESDHQEKHSKWKNPYLG